MPTNANMESSRQYDNNGWYEVKGNPLSKVGIFPYSGKSISKDLDPKKMYRIYRPEEELSHPACIESFKLVPWTDEHAMLGSGKGTIPVDKSKWGGVIGQDVYYEDGYLKGNVKVFTEELDSLIEGGKSELSCGYRCKFDMTPGIYNGQPYDGVQRQIRGNHLATVKEGRMGPDVRVLDYFAMTIDAKELTEMDKVEQALDAIMSHIKMVTERFAADDAEKEEASKKAESAQAEADKKAKDEEETKAKEEAAKKEADDKAKDGDKGMDAKVESLVADSKAKDKTIAGLTASMDEMKKTATKEAIKEVAKRDVLAKELSNHIGTFDHSGMTEQEVAKYGVEKLKLDVQDGHEKTALTAYMAGKKGSGLSFSVDKKERSTTSVVQKHINKKSAK